MPPRRRANQDASVSSSSSGAYLQSARMLRAGIAASARTSGRTGVAMPKLVACVAGVPLRSCTAMQSTCDGVDPMPVAQ